MKLDGDVTEYSLMVAEHAKCLARIAELEALLMRALPYIGSGRVAFYNDELKLMADIKSTLSTWEG